ncbi:MAG: hypothetical protein Kow00107_00740 [Planctomycetota bacterium]
MLLREALPRELEETRVRPIWDGIQIGKCTVPLEAYPPAELAKMTG